MVIELGLDLRLWLVTGVNVLGILGCWGWSLGWNWRNAVCKHTKLHQNLPLVGIELGVGVGVEVGDEDGVRVVVEVGIWVVVGVVVLG